MGGVHIAGTGAIAGLGLSDWDDGGSGVDTG